MSNRIMVCVDQPPEKLDVTKGGVQVPYKWPSGTQIKVRFLDGDLALRAKVEQYAQIWTQFANVLFLFDDDPAASVKISFTQDKTNWSKIGTDCQNYPGSNVPTMNLGQIDAHSSAVDIRAAVLHEFGHVLGCVHEHQLPGTGAIQWNKPVVYSYYGDRANVDPPWSRQQVDQNIFNTYSSKQITNSGSMDKYSIMMYWIDKTWTLDGWSAPVNTDLSKTDKTFISQKYP